MKYKVGDKVKLRSKAGLDELKQQHENLFIPLVLYEMAGSVCTIRSIYDGFYSFEELPTFWAESLIEGLVEDTDVRLLESAADACKKIDEMMEARYQKAKTYYDGEQWSTEFECPEGYIFKDENGNIVNATKIVLEKKTDKYMNENNTKVDMGEVSDGYHTFNELYEYRMLYNAALFNEFAKQGLYDAHKSRKHSDGEYPFGDSNWFIVIAELPTGQISNHYEMKDWDKFQIPEKPLANKWDEHSPRDVAERLTHFTNPKKEYPKTYEECLSVLQIKGYDIVIYVPSWTAYEKTLYQEVLKLRELIICRDAYWKIAGEEMGLGKPWEPDYDSGVDKFGIICLDGVVQESNPTTNWERHLNKILDFPTREMRDAFKENFDPDIEFCKEFL